MGRFAGMCPLSNERKLPACLQRTGRLSVLKRVEFKTSLVATSWQKSIYFVDIRPVDGTFKSALKQRLKSIFESLASTASTTLTARATTAMVATATMGAGCQ